MTGLTVTTDASHQFFVEVKKGGRSETVACALAVRPVPGTLVHTTQLRWSSRMAALLREVATSAKSSGRDEGKSLPYASLRAALQVQLPETILLSHDLGRPWARDEPGQLLSAATDSGDIEARASATLRDWGTMVLKPWAERVEVEETVVDAIIDIAADGGAFAPAEHGALDVGQHIGERGEFRPTMDKVLQIVSKRLEGVEIFEGAGPAYRIVRSGSLNLVELMTWPMQGKDGGRFSMVATLAVETAPYLDHPILVVRASRREWLAEVPAPKKLRQSSMKGYLFADREPRIAVEFATRVDAGVPQEPFSPEYLSHALNIQADLGAGLSDLVSRQGTGGVFLGIPYTSSRDGKRKTGSGATARDQLDLLNVVHDHLRAAGFERLEFVDPPKPRNLPKREAEHHVALKAEALLADIATDLGRNELGLEALTEAWSVISTGDLPKTLKPQIAVPELDKLNELRGCNKQRVVRAFGDMVPRIALIAATEQERSALRLVVDSLFGNAIDVVEYALPPAVHGLRPDLPASGSRAAGRFEARVEAWTPLATQLSAADVAMHVIVQAHEKFEGGRRDDSVNKLAGRYALATRANANVQYLRPMERKVRGFENYLHRVQAAIYDLLFGHSGLVSEVGSVSEVAFPNEETRPKAFLGISVVTQSRTRTGAGGGKLCLATRLDVATGTTTARVGWFENGMQWSRDWVPFFEALKRIASPSITATLGNDRTVERSSFQTFVQTIVDEAVRHGDRPLVMVDSTSAASLWPSLSDTKIGEGLRIGPEQVDVSGAWQGVRIVRVRQGRAGRVIDAKVKKYACLGPQGERLVGMDRERECPTMVERTVRISNRASVAHYWLTHKYFQVSVPRGLSVYRPDIPTMTPPAKLKIDVPAEVIAAGNGRLLSETRIDLRDESYRLPQSIDATVAMTQPGDDADRIAWAIGMLRHGYGHTASWTSLPAPLSFESKVRDYMTRFSLEEADLEDENGPEDGDDDLPDGPGEGDVSTSDEDVADEEAMPSLEADDTVSIAPTNPPASPSPMPAGHNGHKQDEEASVEPQNRIWSGYAKDPVLPVPGFVTVDWLRARIGVVNSAIREMHIWRGETEALSGFDVWPDEKPTFDDLIELFPSGLRYPNFVRALTRQAIRSLSAGKRTDYNLFKPFRASLETIGKRAGIGSRAWSRSGGLEALCKVGEFDAAMDLVFLMSHGIGFDPRYKRVADLYRAELAQVIPFMDAAAEHLPAKFDWEREIVGLKGSPNSPPVTELRTAVVVSSPIIDLDSVEPEIEVADPSEMPVHVDPPMAAMPPVPLETKSLIQVEPPAGGDAHSDRWFQAMAALARLTSGATAEPDGELLALIRRAAAAATHAYRGWETSRPRLVDGRDLAEMAILLASSLQVEMSSRRLAGPPASIRMEAAEHSAIGEGLSQLRSRDEERRGLLEEARSLMFSGDLDRHEEIGQIRDRAKALTITLTAELASLLERLDAAVDNSRTDEEPQQLVVEIDPPTHVPSAVTPIAPAEAETDEEWLEDAGLELAEELTLEGPEPLVEVSVSIAEHKLVEPEVHFVVDPIIEKIELKLSELMSRFDVSLAYHLVRASRRSFPDHAFSFDDAELRLMAMAEFVNHVSMQGSEVLARTLEDAFASAERLGNGELVDSIDDAKQARLIALFGAAASLVLFHPHTSAGQILSVIKLADADLDGAVYQLRDVLVGASRSGVPVTPAMFRAATDAAAEDRHANECRDEILAKIENIGRLQFRFQLGNRIRVALTRSDGALGRLQEALRSNADGGLEAARIFAQAYADRDSIIELFLDAEEAINKRRVQGIDGEARERLVANITELASLCLAYEQARNATPALKVAGSRAMVQSLRDAVIRGLDVAFPALKAAGRASLPLSAAAANYAARCLERLRGALDGRLISVGAYDHLVAVHGTLPWVPGLRFGRSWLPSPYEADTLVRRILQSHLLPQTFSDPEAFETAVRERVSEDSFVSALLLLEQGPFRGIDEATLDRTQEYVHQNVTTRRDKLSADISDARRSVDRIQRLGSLVGADDGQDLLSLLDRIDPTQIPAFKESGVRSEAEEEEAILDFAAAQSILDDVNVRVDRLMDRPRSELKKRLDDLANGERASADDTRRVHRLIERGDLLTAGEYLDFIADGRELPAASSPNPRFHAFYPAVPDFLSKHGSGGAPVLRDAILSGADVGPLAFSRVPEARRDDTARLLEDWLELQRRVQGGVNDVNSIVAMLSTFLDGFGFGSQLNSIDKDLTNPRKRTYGASMRLRLQKDLVSVLLPRFGSLTQGNYRVVVLGKMPTHAEIAPLCENAAAQGVVLFVMETVSRDRRQQLAVACAEARREILVIDEAIVLFGLSQGEFRPLTLFECAQPFSFGAPYRDYGNQAVPAEIFFGRENELRKIVDPSGSCIVYGGRRLGKTALLQQVKEKENNPKAGTVVAFVSIYGLGRNARPAEIWASMSREMTAIFKGEPVKTAQAFGSAVERWLEGDSRRRILVLLDEADEFIRADAALGFREFMPLQRLMDSSSRRFKFVLAGLHNVTRLVHTENPPLKQIASDPQRIGPLMGDELVDAELLVTRPLAALGFEFERREDVWRVLSHCNYYPVLVQTFCKGLLDILFNEVRQSKKVLFPITSEHVHRALENENISREIGEMFEYTLQIDDRYYLIANIMAERALEDTAAGRVGQGMSSVELVEVAARFWPAAFDQTHRLSVIEDLLDEMEGLGVLRRGPESMWSLRSNAILRLLGDDMKIIERLVEFLEKPAPAPFEPRSMRRELHLPPMFKVSPGHSCPLTLGQEHDLLADPVGQSVAVSLIFGNALSDAGVVAAAMREIDGGSGRKVDIVAKTWLGIQSMLDDYRGMRSDAEHTLLVADMRTEWDPSWISTALQSRAVRDGKLSLAFVGGPEHALRWVRASSRSILTNKVRVMQLQLWSDVMIDHHLGQISASSATFSEELRRLTGGFNRSMNDAIGPNAGSASGLQGRIEKLNERLLADPNILGDLGLIGPMRVVFEKIRKWIGDETCITPYEITEAILSETPEITGLDANRVIEFGVLLSLLKAEPTPPGVSDDARRYSLNPLLLDVLKTASVAQAA